MSAYVSEQLRQLDRNLRGLSRKERAEALENYRSAFEQSIHNNYPQRFACPAVIKSDQKYATFVWDGTHLGEAFGPLEVEGNRDVILSEIRKRKEDLSKKSLIQRLSEFFLQREG